MAYPVKIAGFEGQKIEVVPTSFMSGAKLLVNGERAPKGEKRGHFTLTRNDGRQVDAYWKPNKFGLDVPSLVVGDELIEVVEPLTRSQLIWSVIPLLLIFLGGALGALIGFVAMGVNIRIFHSQQSELAKIGLAAVVFLLSIGAYVALATLIATLFFGGA